MIINSFSIIDFKNKEAQNFNFNDGVNLIVSKDNTQGKSSLLKSMYFTLGFDVRQFPSGWDIDDMYFQIEVSINNEIYSITRQKDIFKVSDKNNIMNVKEYSDWLQTKLNIKMKLANTKNKNLYDAYSSAVILPFYIDQDDSWDGGMYKNVTNTLNQYTRIPEDIFKGAFDLSSFEILELQNLLNDSNKEKNKIDTTIESLSNVLKEYIEENKDEPIVAEIDKEALNEEINRYLQMQNDFNEQIIKYKVKLLNKQEILGLQKQELSELERLLQLNKKRYKSIEAECQYCHSKLTNEQSLTRLNLSNNYFEISLLKDEVEKEIEKLTKDIKEFRLQQNFFETKVNDMHERINKSKDLLTIDTYIKAIAKSEASSELEGLVNKQFLEKSKLQEQISSLRKQIKKLEKEKEILKENIEKEYDILLFDIKKKFTGVNLNELKFLDFKRIAGSGMDKNKKYLAYYLIYFSLLRKFSSYKIPFCMDSFIKNEITGESAKEMFEAIESYFFDAENQSFFSIVLENLNHLKNGNYYNKVEVSGKLLSKDKYDEIAMKFEFNS